MPQPTPSDAHVNAPLTNISVAYLQDQDAFIGIDAFPVVPVEKQSNVYFEFTKEDFYRDEARVRAPSTESAGGGFTLKTNTYNVIVNAYHKDIDDQLRANADSVLSLDAAATRFTTLKLLIQFERKWMSTFFTTGVWGTDVTPTALWSTTSTPGQDVETGKQAILGVTGYAPNTLILGYPVFSALRRNAEIRDQFKYTSAKSIDTEMMAQFFGVDRVLVSKSVYTSTVEGNATQTTGLIGGKNALLCYVAPAPSLLEPSAGYTFSWTGYTGAMNGFRVSRFRIEERRSDRIEGETAFIPYKVGAALGYFFSGAVA